MIPQSQPYIDFSFVAGIGQGWPDTNLPVVRTKDKESSRGFAWVPASIKMSMQLLCQSCGKPIPAQDVNIEMGIAKCSACNAVFDFLDEVGARSTCQTNIGLPKRFTVENWGPELVITCRWFNHGVWFLLLFCIFWDGFLAVWYSAVIAGLVNGKMGAIVLLPLLFPILHVAIGVGLTYSVLCTFLNRTVIRASVAELTVRHGPLYWAGNCQHLTSDLK